MARARWRSVELPWFVPALGQPPGSAGLQRLRAHYDLVAVPAGADNPGWYENLELGVSVVMIYDRVDCIIFSADPRHGFGGPHTPCFLGARWGMSREQVRALFGLPDEERGPYPAAGSLAHGGIDRYRSRGFAVAFSYGASGEGLARMDFECPDE